MGKKILDLGLQDALVTSYDQTKTTLQGNIGQRTINDGNGNNLCIGPQPVVSVDVFDDTGVTLAGPHCSTSNARIFVSQGFAAGVLTIAYYLRTTTAGVTTVVWQGSLKFTFTNTGAYTIRGFSVDDTTSSAMNFSWYTTNTTAQQGGWYACFGVNITDFVKVSIQTFPVATLGSTTKTVYQIGDTASQAAHTVTVADGGEIDSTNGFNYILNGAAATPKIFKFVNTVPTTAPTAGYSIANGAVVITGNLTAFSGVILLVNCVKLLTPGSWSSNSGALSLSWITTTTIYHAKVSDITNAVTSLPTLFSATMGDGVNLTPTAAFGQYSQSLDQFVIMTTTGNVITKRISNDPNTKYWGLNNYIKTEIGLNTTPADFGAITNLALTVSNGFAIMGNTSVGQRGLVVYDLTADESSVGNATSSFPGQINASIITKVITGNLNQGITLGLLYEYAKRVVKPTIQYRTSNFSTGPGAGFDATWTTAPKSGDLSLLVNATSVQFRLLFTMMALEVTNPAQLISGFLLYNDNVASSANWVGSVDNTSANGANPFKVSFRLQTAYASTVPKLFIRGTDDSGNVVIFDTVTNVANMDYTTNNGTSYTPMGTIPNTALTTELRFSWTSPDGVRRRWSINES